MQIKIDIYFEKYGNQILKSGDFPVRPALYKKNEAREAARAARRFIRQIEEELGKITVEKVVCNGNRDITEFLKF